MSLSATTYVDAWIDGIDITPASDTGITVKEAKDWARIDESYDDGIVDALIGAAQRAFEEFTKTFLYETTVTVRYSFDNAGNVEFRLPYGPVDSITSVKDDDDEDVSYTQHDDWIKIDGHGGTDIEVVYKAKRYNAGDDLDKMIRIGLQKWIATNYDDRQNTIVDNINEMPNGSKMMWQPFKRESI